MVAEKTKLSHECESGTHECVRYYANFGTTKGAR